MEVARLFTRSLLRVLATSGIVAVIGYLMAPRRRSRFSLNWNQLPFSMRDVTRMLKTGRKLMRAVTR
ncbi:hypothetical protein EN829_051570 [Mesorhizobium sp. M00.F.Ca.ET.186.01.1.1]|nr:hypothetical protein [Brevibacillus parabrevis]NRQ55543.1 hypothetical protein [Brevibacillus sp. HD1.4A]RNB95364.1 hypothetical protein EDM60_11945 [Brevibacillus parabrevis]TGV08839.1 hypothetical protein EN829_051570 [Mesorhizobium sp. M00.F.Ca.ET.186.01.1.1]HBZ80220.1 hypothetical protein [Brevibacillus sp.]